MHKTLIRFVAVAAAVFVMPIGSASAQTIATIYGQYDTCGTTCLPSSVTSDPRLFNSYSSFNDYDTPTLFFVNPTAYNFTNAQMVLTVGQLFNQGQPTLNDGATQTVGLGTIGPNGISQVSWGSGGQIFTYDYDDEYPNNYGGNPIGNSGSATQDCTLNVSQPQWFNFCAPVGNFGVVFTAMLQNPSDPTDPNNGLAIAAVFNEFDVNGNYTGWEGIDPIGWSENATYDVHSGNVTGVLANIQIGTPGTVTGSPVTATPEPASMALMATGLVGLAGWAKHRKHRS